MRAPSIIPLQSLRGASDLFADLQSGAPNAAAGEGPVHAGTLHQSFELHAARSSHQPALIAEGRAWSFGELNAKANRIARRIRAAYVETHAAELSPGTPIVLYVTRSADMVAALLGVMKAGAAYTPVTVQTPPARLAEIIANSGTPMLVTERRHLPRIDQANILPGASAGVIRLCVDDRSHDTELASTDLRTDVGPREVAYIIHTSGSTGVPKGVLTEHASAIELSKFMFQLGLPTATGAWGWISSYAFDASIEAIGLLCLGCRIVMVDEDKKTNLASIERLASQFEVDVFDATPSLVKLWQLQGSIDRLPHLVLGGEAISRELWRELVEFQNRSGKVVLNMYGPTECTVNSTCARVAGAEPTIGRPLPHTRGMLAVSSESELHGHGIGELWLAGAGLARGYLNLPRLSEERFPSVTLTDGERVRIYRTGDLARVRPDGQLTYEGRIDRQVKIDGYRIELGEVESHVSRLAGVANCAVVVAEEDDFRYLVAYVVARPNIELRGDKLAAHLREQIPPYMVPYAWVAVERLPMTPNGKLDLDALPPCPSPSRCAASLELRANSLDELRVALHHLNPAVTLRELGLDSLAVVQLTLAIARIASLDGAHLILTPDTKIGDLSTHLCELRETAEFEDQDSYPASHTQHRFVRSQRRIDVNDSVALCFTFRNAVATDSLKAFVDALTNKHALFRTALLDTERGLWCKVMAAPPVSVQSGPFDPIRILDLVDDPFELEKADVARFLILQHDRVSLIMNLFHGITDGFSKRILVHELIHYVRHGCLTPYESSYSKFAQYERSRRSTYENIIGRNRQYLERSFADQRRPIGPPLITDGRGFCKHIDFPPEIYDQLKMHLAKAGYGHHQLFMALIAFVAMGHFDRSTIGIVSPIANRPTNDSMHTFGAFINLVVVKYEFHDARSLSDFVAANSPDYQASFQLSSVPYQMILDSYPGYASNIVVVGGVDENFDAELAEVGIDEIILEDTRPCSKNLITFYYYYKDELRNLRLKCLFNRSAISEGDATKFLDDVQSTFLKAIAK